MRLIRRKAFSKCVLLLLAICLQSIAVSVIYFAAVSAKQQRALAKQSASINLELAEKEYHSKNLLQVNFPLSPSPQDHSVPPSPPCHLLRTKTPSSEPSHNPPPKGKIPARGRALPTVPSRRYQFPRSPPLQPRHSSLLLPPSKLPPQSELNLSVSGCKSRHCEEALSQVDKTRLRMCLTEVSKNNKKVPPKELVSRIVDNNCIFIPEGKKRAPVALVSAEGSGNTWVRGLLEKSSGFCTGFNFCDYVMRMKGFVGENINSGSVLVVKTHTKMPQWIGSKTKKNRNEAAYGSGILLVRNPYDSLIAEWNRRLTNNVLIKQGMPHNESHVNVALKEIWCKQLSLWAGCMHSRRKRSGVSSIFVSRLHE